MCTFTVTFQKRKMRWHGWVNFIQKETITLMFMIRRAYLDQKVYSLIASIYQITNGNDLQRPIAEWHFAQRRICFLVAVYFR